MAGARFIRWTMAALALAMPPLLAQPSTDEDLLRANKVGSGGPALLAFFRQRTLAEEDCRKIEALVRQHNQGALSSYTAYVQGAGPLPPRA